MSNIDHASGATEVASLASEPAQGLGHVQQGQSARKAARSAKSDQPNATGRWKGRRTFWFVAWIIVASTAAEFRGWTPGEITTAWTAALGIWVAGKFGKAWTEARNGE